MDFSHTLDDGRVFKLYIVPERATATPRNSPAPAGGEKNGTPSASAKEPTSDRSVKQFQLRWVATDAEANVPADFLPDASDRNGQQKLRVLRPAVLDGSEVESATVEDAKSEPPSILVKLNAEGTRKFSEATGKNIGRRLAIVWNGQVLSAPLVSHAFRGGEVQISGNFKKEEMQLLLRVLNHDATEAASRPTRKAD